MATLAAIGGLASMTVITKFMESELQTVVLKDEKEDFIPVHCNLAGAYGKLNSQTIKAMDVKMKVMISGTIRSLEKADLKGKRLTWNEIQGIFNQNVLLEKVPNSDVDRSKTFFKNTGNDWKFDGSPDDRIVKEVKKWFENELVNDVDIVDDTQINIKCLANIVAQTGAQVTTFLNFFHKQESHRRTVVDIGVLRFPDIDNPFFKVYRIKLTAWSDCTRTLFHQEDRNGIEGDFNCRKYRPRESVLAEMKDEIIKKAAKEAEDLFG